MKKVIIASMIGNALEWYDYALYAQFISIISQHFFPTSEIKEILTLAVFAAGFIIRPLGGILFGIIGDRYGRKVALLVCILTMSIPTAAIGFLPGYNTIGIAAPIILTIIRLIQGFSLGGELSGCTLYLVELAPNGYRGLMGSMAMVSACTGMLMGVATASCFSYFMEYEKLVAWGWRIPFIAGLVIAVVGVYIRKNLSESPIYKMAQAKGQLSKAPINKLFTNDILILFIAIGIYLSVTAPFYTITVFIENFMKTIGYKENIIRTISVSILITMIIMMPISAFISDKLGRKPVLTVGIICLIISLYPIFKVLELNNNRLALISQIIFACLVSFYIASVPVVLVELFETNIRFTGSALAQNLAAACFGGTTPMIGMMLFKYTNDKCSMSYYLILLAFISLITLKFYKETYKKDLSKNEQPK